jgi:hypothetical protein
VTAKIELFFSNGDLAHQIFVGFWAGNECDSINSFVLRVNLSFHETLGPKPVFVENGNYGVSKVAAITKVNRSIDSGSVTLPNRSVLFSVKQLDQ